MKIFITHELFDELVTAAEEVVPEEACGLMAGKDGAVEKFYPMTNADASAEHYSMVPEEQFAVMKDMRVNGLEMAGIWHSHPVTPARMSEEDKKLAYQPNVVYFILSLADPASPVLKGFEMVDGEPVEVELEVRD